MATSDFTLVVKILRSLYQKVQSLDMFADGIVFKEGHKPRVIEESDNARFASFVRGVYVCSDKELQQVPSCREDLSLLEVLAFVMNSLKSKKRKNVLTHGYNFLPYNEQQRNSDQLRFQADVTLNAAYIHGSDMWKKVTKRLGTDITHYLLLSCSVFVAVPPSCLFQLCGLPVYDRLPMTSSLTGLALKPQSSSRKASKTSKNVGLLRSKAKFGNGLRKRKRELHSADDEYSQTPAKRRLVDYQNKAEEQPMLLDPVQVPKSSENSSTGLKEEGGPSWRFTAYPPVPSSQCFIRTLGLLYGGKGMRSFLLNRKKMDGKNVKRLQGQDLIRLIFFEGLGYLNGVQRKPKKLPQRFFNMVPIFNQLLRRHRRVCYGRALQKLCPSLQHNHSDRQGELSSLLSQHCAVHRVYLFVRESLNAVIPRDLWGSEQNRIFFLASVRSFLSSGKFERLSLAELLWKMKVNDCEWIKFSKTGGVPPSELAYRTKILGRFLVWLLGGFVVGLIRACFYVTESVGQKNALRFYRQEVWAKLQDLAFKGHLSKGQMEELTPMQVAALPKSTVISHLRFIPKKDGMRPITRVIGADGKTRIYRAHIRDLLDILRACVRSTPSILGSTVWGMTDIHKVLRTVAPQQKKNPQALYFVKADVSGAYDSLPHDKLLEVVTQTLTPFLSELFTVRRYAKVWIDFNEGLKKAFVRQPNFLQDSMGFTNMKSFVSSMQKSGSIHHSILIEQHHSLDLRATDALQNFAQMLTGSIVQFGKRTYRQCRGIPQGSVVSGLLCCLCYGHMENVLFKNLDINKGRKRLLRLVDDFLLITPDANDAQMFLKTLLSGVPQYGLTINPQKVVVNFPVPEALGVCPEVRVLPQRCLLPWCGLLLDTHSLDVYKDYCSYAGLSLRYSLTLGSSRSAGLQMRRKLMAILRLKCHALFLDLETNSVQAVYQNVYKLVLLHALRFHVCTKSLPFGQTVTKNPGYFLQMIWDMARFGNELIKKSNKDSQGGAVIQHEAVELIFCICFLRVLSQHRLMYKGVLPHLQQRKRSLQHRLGDLRVARVRQAVGHGFPQDFLVIHT